MHHNDARRAFSCPGGDSFIGGFCLPVHDRRADRLQRYEQKAQFNSMGQQNATPQEDATGGWQD